MSVARQLQVLAGVALLLGPLAPACFGRISARADDSAACSALADENIRRTCLDAAAIPRAKEGVQAPTSIDARAASPLSGDAYQTVTVTDLSDRSQAILRHPIALGGARCFYFGVGDYRCLVPGASTVAVLAQVIFPPGAQVAVERGCEEGKPGSPLKCEYKLLFVPASFRKVDKRGGGTALVFDTSAVMFAPAPAPRSVVPVVREAQ